MWPTKHLCHFKCDEREKKKTHNKQEKKVYNNKSPALALNMIFKKELI